MHHCLINFKKNIPEPFVWQSPAEKTGVINIENISKINNPKLLGKHDLKDLTQLVTDAANVTGDAVSDINITF